MHFTTLGDINYNNPDWLLLIGHVPQTTAPFVDFEYDHRKYQNKITIFDHYTSYQEDDKHFCLDRIFLGSYFLWAITDYTKTNYSFVDASEKDIDFVAYMNKSRPDRLLTSFWLNKKFDRQHNFFYTQGFGGKYYRRQLYDLIKDTDYSTWLRKNNSPFLTPRFLGKSASHYHSFRKNYQHIISHTERRARLSIVNESMFWEKGNIFTEKTLQACLSCCVPFFVNMYEAPEYFEKIGFYAFKDLIDYSHMREPNPVIRTLKLLDANIDLLTYGFDISKYKYEIEHNFRHAQDVLGVLKNIYKLNNQKLFQDWFEVIISEINLFYPLKDVFKKLEKVL